MKTRILVDEFIISLRAKGDRPCTLTWYGSIVGRLAKAYKELPESVGPIEGFLGGLEVNFESRRSTIRALRAFYRWVKKRHKVRNPMLQITMPRRRKQNIYYLSTVELAWIMALPLCPRDKALVWLLIDTGVRIGEALNLSLEDIYDEYIMVDGKTGQREVPISPEVRAQLLALGTRSHIFWGTKGALGQTGAYNIVHKAFKLAGIQAKKWGPHVLRHTFGRQYILAGGDLVSLQRILGHANIATTRIYADLDLRDITIQHAKFTPLKTAQTACQGLLWQRAGIELSPASKN
jgi:integrase/recombinase XerD